MTSYFIVSRHMLSLDIKMHNSSASSFMCLSLIIMTNAVLRIYEFDTSRMIRWL